jgi:hypothetical protein
MHSLNQSHTWHGHGTRGLLYSTRRAVPNKRTPDTYSIRRLNHHLRRRRRHDDDLKRARARSLSLPSFPPPPAGSQRCIYFKCLLSQTRTFFFLKKGQFIV